MPPDTNIPTSRTDSETISLSQLDYIGGGYFRVKADAGIKSPTFHGSEILEKAITRADALMKGEK